jgi:DNA-binding response OmpR family regulator
LLPVDPLEPLKKMVSERRKTVLVVEKQPNYTQLLVKQIMFAGLRPVIAVTGEGGLRKATEYHPDLILLELDLTDMDGLEFVSLLKEKSQLEKIPIVAMSIFSYMKMAALYGGCDDFLKKPVRMIDLMAHIRHFLHRESRMPKDRGLLAG